ncbi:MULTISPECIES: nickel/cobalt ABC transporter permease [unclassified Paenibacillus]|uniref:nickel/cobalt ABC transporter permease n=1 Tax=unclassified Paenibacillus TaxID=185978 RepID=UPI000953D9F6|nr:MULTISPECIES: nickel/cobalt ABC transporter permease [unclassified Paenibacillus]ASS65371.1 ABC transporter permease subunit [Paenibacillus sp. RUD330]SIQ38435.1 nickel transport system permease protein [Paenibacillus sp. RU4X]SIQ60619.1 nickel transport system permease protein [Paenibacillus sp. RU4T]
MKRISRLLSDRLALLSLAVLAAIAAAGMLAPWLAPHPPDEVNMALRYGPWSLHYPLGNDQLGRCVLSRLLYGIRPSVLLVLAAVLASVLIGAAVGMAAGYAGGRTDALLMRLCDVMLSFPGYVMTLAVIGVLGVGLQNILLAFILMKWAWFARIVRASVRQIADADYVRFARTLGTAPAAILFRHILPVCLPELAVVASSSFGSTLLQVSGLSFLGLGIQAPQAEWGMMLSEARQSMFSRPELMLAPGLMIVLTVSAVNFLSDAMQQAVDPQAGSSKRHQPARAEAALIGKEVV